MSYRFLACLSIMLAAALTVGCTALLPKSKSETEAPWKTFEEVKQIYDSIQPGTTTLQELKLLGYDPFVNKNVAVLHYSDVLGKYAPNANRDEFLEPGLRECLQSSIRCSAFAIEYRQSRRTRVGNFFLDFINYERRTEITGWRFGAVVVIVGERVVYKSWNGVPSISEVEETKNPLGPVQEKGTTLFFR